MEQQLPSTWGGHTAGCCFSFPFAITLQYLKLFRNVASTISSRFAAVEGLHDECVGVDPVGSAGHQGREVDDNQVGSRSIMFVAGVCVSEESWSALSPHAQSR